MASFTQLLCTESYVFIGEPVFVECDGSNLLTIQMIIFGLACDLYMSKSL